MTVKELAKQAKCSQSWVYTLCLELDRLPTIEEIEERKTRRGRPKKWVNMEKKRK